ncbi:hypothetical protein PPUN12996_38630 [Pseudomonas putida]|nr:hypothetical protein PPUN12996_38630 [Pseudomonas putida]
MLGRELEVQYNADHRVLASPITWVHPLGLAACPMREVNGAKIFGKGQKDGTRGHDQFSEAIANKLAMSGKFKEIYLNRSYSFANGKRGNRAAPRYYGY